MSLLSRVCSAIEPSRPCFAGDPSDFEHHLEVTLGFDEIASRLVERWLGATLSVRRISLHGS